MCGFFKRNCLEVQKFLPLTQFLLVFAARSCGDLPSWHWNPELGVPGVGLGLLAPKISLLNFYPSHIGEGLAHFSCAPLLQVWVDVFSLIP